MKKLFSILLILMLVVSMATPAMAAKAKTTISLSKTDVLTLVIGKTEQITATVTPAAAVTWSSKKPSVADVDANGKITAKAEGTTTITAKAGGKSARIKVKVVDPNKPSKIIIKNGKTAKLDIDKTLQLVTQLEPEGAKATLTWKSSKPAVAAVDANGKVTPKAEGKAKITVTTHNKKKATITVTVIDPYKPTKLKLKQGKKKTLTEGDTLQLTIDPTPATADTSVVWMSSKTKVATVADGVVTFASGLTFKTDLFTEADVGSYGLYYGVGKQTMNIAEKILRVERGTVIVGSLKVYDAKARTINVDGKLYEFCALLGHTDNVTTYMEDGGCIGDIVHLLLTPEGYVASIWQ